MKKAIKKFMAALLAVAMLCAMAVPAMAAGTTTHTLTINGKTSGHTYEAYQVFTGTLEGNVLSDITFGSGVDGNAILSDSDLPSELANSANAAELAKNLSELASGSDQVNAFAKVVSKHLTNTKYTSTEAGTTYTIGGLPDGYYFVKDASDTLPEGATYSRYMLDIVSNATIDSKDTSVTLDKQIKHNETDSWGVVGDNQIGDTVYFRTITTVPDTTGYETYTYKIHDTMSSEITSNVKSASDVTIRIGDGESAAELSASYYSVEVSGNSFTVSVDIIAAKNAGLITTDSKLYTYYSGVLNESARMYTEGPQSNTAYLEYSNNPNGDGTGETVKKTVYDWTFTVEVVKVDGADHSKTLSGAEFVLSRNGGLLENGVLKEGYETELIPVTAGSDGSYTIALSGTNYTMTTPDNGQISIKGLDDSVDYYLYEIKAPAGYNTLTSAVKFTISTRTDSNYSTSGESITENPTVTVGSTASNGMTFNVENNTGATLPSTGGMGTTLFYVVGGGLMVAAAVLLITKKRMENK